MLLLALFQVLVTWDAWLLAGEEFWNSLRWLQVAMLGILAIAASTSSRRVQKTTAVLGFLLAFFAVFVLRYLSGAFGPVTS